MVEITTVEAVYTQWLIDKYHWACVKFGMDYFASVLILLDYSFIYPQPTLAHSGCHLEYLWQKKKKKKAHLPGRKYYEKINKHPKHLYKKWAAD